MQYHVNGTLVPREDATVSVTDRGVLYGDGITERLRAYGGRVFQWMAHAERIDRRCGALSIPVPDDLHERIEGTLAANDLADATVRLSIVRGGGPSLSPTIDAAPTIVIAVEPATRGGRQRAGPTGNGPAAERVAVDPDDAVDRRTGESGDGIGPEDDGENGESSSAESTVVQTVTIRRPGDGDPLAERAAAIRARLELARAATDRYRADEALVRDREGFVAGGAASDVLFVDDAALRVPETAPVDVLRPVVCDLAREEGIPVERGRYRPNAVREASEAFLASAVEGLRPIVRLDGIGVGDGPVRKLLSATLDELIETRFY